MSRVANTKVRKIICEQTGKMFFSDQLTMIPQISKIVASQDRDSKLLKLLKLAVSELPGFPTGAPPSRIQKNVNAITSNDPRCALNKISSFERRGGSMYICAGGVTVHVWSARGHPLEPTTLLA